MLIDTVDYSKDDESDDPDSKTSKSPDDKKIFDNGKVEVDDDNIEDIMKHLEKYNN